MTILPKAAFIAAALATTGVAHASVVFSPTPGTITYDHDAGNPVNLGNVFTANTNGKVTSLGFFTPTNLLGGGQTVGLYDSNGTLLSSTFVSATTSTPGQYVFQAVAPVLLIAGQQYTVVTNVGQNAWAYGATTANGVTFNYNSYAYGSALAFTTNTGGSGPSYLGANLDIGAVPEPATWAMMLLGFGMIGFAARRRQRVKTTVTYA